METEIKGYPLDDVPYLAQDIGKYNLSLTNGVVAMNGNLSVVSNNDMTVTLKAGRAFMNAIYRSLGVWLENDVTLTIDTASGTYNRMDAIALFVDFTTSKVVARVVKGNNTSGISTAPTITRNSTSWELFVAYIGIPKGTTAITAMNIIDCRPDTTVCGLVRNGVEEIPTDVITARFAELMATYEKAITDLGSMAIADGSVTNAKLSDDAVNTDKIDDYAVTKEKLSVDLQEKMQEKVLLNNPAGTKAVSFNLPETVNNYSYLEITYFCRSSNAGDLYAVARIYKSEFAKKTILPVSFTQPAGSVGLLAFFVGTVEIQFTQNGDSAYLTNNYGKYIINDIPPRLGGLVGINYITKIVGYK